MKQIFLFFIALVLFSNCETTLEVPIPQSKPKIAVSMALSMSADTQLISGKVFRSIPYFTDMSNEDFEIRDADVTLSNGNSLHILKYDLSEASYKPNQNFTLKEGNTYTLSVKTKDGNILTSEELMPYSPILQSVKAKLSKTSNDLNFFTTINLNSNSSKFYKIEINIDNDYNFYFYSPTLIAVPNDGRKSHTFSSKMYFSSYEADSLEFSISSINEAFYRFDNIAANYWGDNPFSEPTPLPSNINGGLGIFSLSNTLTVKIPIEK